MILASIEPPPWVFNVINKILREFLLKGSDSVAGGHCLVNWCTVCRPKTLFGLGILDLNHMHTALLVRRVWRIRTLDDKSWNSLGTPIDKQVIAIFNAAIRVAV